MMTGFPLKFKLFDEFLIIGRMPAVFFKELRVRMGNVQAPGCRVSERGKSLID